MRLDKYIASVTDYSRSQVKGFIKQGDVLINEKPASNPAEHIVVNRDQVSLYQQLLEPLLPRYFMLNKPVDTVCATTDGEHPTVIDLLNEPNGQKLHIAGRLDKDTTGLVLITDDGQWSHNITSPTKACIKVYRVNLAQALSAQAKAQLEQGIALHHEKTQTLPATVNVIHERLIELGIQEGKYHQVKRMLAVVGNKVTALHRQQVGSITLDTHLALGQYRALTTDEVHQSTL